MTCRDMSSLGQLHCLFRTLGMRRREFITARGDVADLRRCDFILLALGSARG